MCKRGSRSRKKRPLSFSPPNDVTSPPGNSEVEVLEGSSTAPRVFYVATSTAY
jgi:hypothetical protein